MARSFTRPDSAFIYLRTRRIDGSWGKVRTAIRVDDPDVKRKTAMAVAKASIDEAMQAGSAQASFRGWSWVPEFLHRHYDNAKSLQRAQNCWAALSVFLETQGITGPEMVTHRLGHDYVTWRQHPPKGTVKARAKNTALTEIKILSQIMQEAVKLELATGNPLFRLGIKRAPCKQKAEVLPEEQELIERALLNEPQWMQDAWLVAMCHGCRLREVAVPMREIRGQTLVFKGKKDKLHAAPLHEKCLPLVERRRAEGAALLVDLPAMPSKAWHSFFKRLGLGHLSFHSTRVTVVSRLIRANVSPAVVMQYVGHASQTVNEIYRRHRPLDVAHLGALL